MDLSSIRKDRSSVTVDFMGETLTLKYRPAMITPKTYHKLAEADSVDELSAFFADLIVDWDLTKGGDPMPVNKENVAELPMQLIRGISSAIMSDSPQREAGNE